MAVAAVVTEVADIVVVEEVTEEVAAIEAAVVVAEDQHAVLEGGLTCPTFCSPSIVHLSESNGSFVCMSCDRRLVVAPV